MDPDEQEQIEELAKEALRFIGESLRENPGAASVVPLEYHFAYAHGYIAGAITHPEIDIEGGPAQSRAAMKAISENWHKLEQERFR